MNDVSWLLELLAIVRQRPGMFLGNEEVSTLDTFLHGTIVGRAQCGGDVQPAHDLLADFSLWLNARSPHTPTSTWTSWIISGYVQPETISLHRRSSSTTDGSVVWFFELFDQFLATRGLAFPKVTAELQSRWTTWQAE
jgi:hypothetical protein